MVVVLEDDGPDDQPGTRTCGDSRNMDTGIGIWQS